MKKRDEYVEKMKANLDDLNARIDAIAEKSDSAKRDIRAKYKQEMADLRAQSRKASDKLEELKNAGEDSWDNAVEEMEKVSNAFKHSYSYFKSQL